MHIPYKGGAQAMQDLLGGQVAAYFSVPSTAEPHIATGELVRVLDSPDVKEELLKRGLIPSPTTREELGRYIASESVVWEKVVRERKITAN